MTNFEIITIIANQLANAGKKPTVALIKAKLPSPIPLPQMISALKNWQHEPENCILPENNASEDVKEKDSQTESEETLTLGQVNALIERALAPIKAELEEVKKQLKQEKI